MFQGTVLIVFDLESSEVPMPLGIFVATDENITEYRTPEGIYKYAPSNCVIVKGVVF